MKSTGIVRKIDELGRIVIPKEIRKNLKIKDNENLEIFIEEDSIIFKKFSKMDDLIVYINKLVYIFNKVSNYNIVITDRDYVIAAIGEEVANYKNKQISEKLSNIIESRQLYESKEKTNLQVISEKALAGVFNIQPLIVDSEVLGVVIINNTYYDPSISILTKILSFLINDQIDIN